MLRPALLLVGPIIVALVGCAGRAPQPVAVVQPQDRYADCTAIQAEILANNKTVQGLASEEGAKVAQNIAAGLAGLFIWPLWFGMDFQGTAGKEEAALQNRQEYLAALAVQRGCAGPAPAVAAAVAPPAAYSAPPIDAQTPMRAAAAAPAAYSAPPIDAQTPMRAAAAAPAAYSAPPIDAQTPMRAAAAAPAAHSAPPIDAQTPMRAAAAAPAAHSASPIDAQAPTRAAAAAPLSSTAMPMTPCGEDRPCSQQTTTAAF